MAAFFRSRTLCRRRENPCFGSSALSMAYGSIVKIASTKSPAVIAVSVSLSANWLLSAS